MEESARAMLTRAKGHTQRWPWADYITPTSCLTQHTTHTHTHTMAYTANPLRSFWRRFGSLSSAGPRLLAYGTWERISPHLRRADWQAGAASIWLRLGFGGCWIDLPVRLPRLSQRAWILSRPFGHLARPLFSCSGCSPFVVERGATAVYRHLRGI